MCVCVFVYACACVSACVFMCLFVCGGVYPWLSTAQNLQSLFCVLYSCKGVKIHGITYKQGSLIRITSNDGQGDPLFVYAQVVCTRIVYVYQDFKIFITNKLSISDFVNNLRAISVDVTSDSLVCLSTQLYSHGVLHIKQHAHSSYIIEKDHWAKHTLFYWVKFFTVW